MKKNTITLDGNNQGVHEEFYLDEADGALPGQNVVLLSSGEVGLGAGVASATLPMILKEDALQGKTVDDAYADGDLVQVLIPTRGYKAQVLVLSGENIDAGELLVADANGKFVATAVAPAQFMSLESSGGALAGDTLLAVRAL